MHLNMALSVRVGGGGGEIAPITREVLLDIRY